MAAEHAGVTRIEILDQLGALDAAGFDGEEVAGYVAKRDDLLTALASIDAPWTQEERHALQQVLDGGSRAWERMVEQRAQLVARLQSVQQRRRLTEVQSANAWVAGPRRVC